MCSLTVPNMTIAWPRARFERICSQVFTKQFGGQDVIKTTNKERNYRECRTWELAAGYKS